MFTCSIVYQLILCFVCSFICLLVYLFVCHLLVYLFVPLFFNFFCAFVRLYSCSLIYLQIDSNLMKLVPNCPQLFKLVKISSKLSKFVQSCLEWFKIISVFLLYQIYFPLLSCFTCSRFGVKSFFSNCSCFKKFSWYWQAVLAGKVFVLFILVQTCPN